jgi:phenylpropionate dioxygenase-like ring-hydroxylating dioxygenase large terminal subunit
MTLSPGHWYAVLSSRELDPGPVSKVRFGERLVFWRDAAGAPACLIDRCPHRGAALSLGAVVNGRVACPYHGFEFDGAGRCLKIPPEGPDWPIPAHFQARPRPVREGQDFIWLWRGPALPAAQLPPLPRQPGLDGLVFNECVQAWPAHYTRCVEGVVDHSHLAFVHRKTLGRRIKDPVTRIRVDDTPGGFRANLLQGEGIRHHVDFTYPNIWTQLLADGYAMSATFAPIDERRTEVYCRVHHRFGTPLLRPLMQLWCRLSNWLVFHEDQAVLLSQRPLSADEAGDEKLVPSDAGVVAFRKLRSRHQHELAGWPATAGPSR